MDNLCFEGTSHIQKKTITKIIIQRKWADHHQSLQAPKRRNNSSSQSPSNTLPPSNPGTTPSSSSKSNVTASSNTKRRYAHTHTFVISLNASLHLLFFYIYGWQIEVLKERETVAAKSALQQGNRDLALLALRRKKYQETLLRGTAVQLMNLEELVRPPSFLFLSLSFDSTCHPLPSLCRRRRSSLRRCKVR